MIDLTNRQQLIGYLQSHGLYTKKSLGQNFLVDRVALDKIVEAAELSSNDCIIEVGPGLGVLTEELVKSAGKVIAVELDQKLVSILEERFCNVVISSHPEPPRGWIEGGEKSCCIHDDGILTSSRQGGIPQDDSQKRNLSIINSDILHVKLNDLVGGCASYKVVANIPYYITSKILRFFLEAEKKPETIVLLTQKEVAQQITAKPGDMSLLSVSVHVYGDPEVIDLVKSGSFFPAPKVDSAILRVKNIGWKVVDVSEKNFFRVVRMGFSSRRKTLLNNLSAGYQLDKKTTLDILEKAGLTERTRAQELSIEKWQELCVAITNVKIQAKDSPLGNAE